MPSELNKLLLCGFLLLLQSLPEPNVKSRTVANKNVDKNRYINILPYDESRVDLADRPESGPKYINASFIDGYEKEKMYIATQGPIEKSLDDFWMMVWMQNANRIVMVTKLIEGYRPKCCQYWPKDVHKSQKYGDITVKMTSETVQYDFTVRQFTIHKSKEPERKVQQFHYTTWPDQGVPETCTALIKFHRAIFRSAAETEGPVVIHCSAGVGRSGTLIALDKLLNEAAAKQSIDLLKCIEGLRMQRMYMVQTLAQYIFLHHVMLEELLLGDVTIPASANFTDEYKRLRKPQQSDKQSLIDKQFQVLAVLKPKLDEELCSVAKARENTMRNRSTDSLPMDHSLVYLRPVEEDDNTYVNAVSVKGYQSTHPMYIATQMPMQSTASDFWRLVKDNSCIAIVMLNSLDSTNSSEQYWPVDGSSIVVGKFTVTNIGPELCSDNIVVTNLSVSYDGRLKKMVTRVWWTLPRDLVLWGFDHGRIQLVMFNFQTLTDASPPLPNRSANGLRNPSVFDRSPRSGHRTTSSSSTSTTTSEDDDVDGLEVDAVETSPGPADVEPGLYANVSPPTSSSGVTSFTVRHMRVLDWPRGGAVPHDPNTLLTLHSQLAECQHDRDKDHFLVHCLHGVERTGLFCAMMNMLDQLVADKEVDVYDAVKRVRQARPEFVDSIEQYRYLYELAECYLSSSPQVTEDGPLYANSSML